MQIRDKFKIFLQIIQELHKRNCQNNKKSKNLVFKYNNIQQ